MTDASSRASGTTRSGVAPFSIDGVTFTCWIVDGGQSYEWRSACGQAQAGRDVRSFWARAAGRSLGSGFATLRLAMHAAAKAIARRAA